MKVLAKKFTSLFTRSGRSTTSATLNQWPEEPLHLTADQSGGFYAAALGETLNSRYTVVQKLGWGQHSNVWLAKDDLRTQTYVAIKILSVHATSVQGDVADELGLHQRLRDSVAKSDYPGSRNVLPLWDNFEIVSTHGRHLCLVHPVMGRVPKTQDGMFPAFVVKSIAKQMLYALSLIHSEGIIHTDLKPDNILVDIDIVKPIELFENFPSHSTPSARHHDAPSPKSAPVSRPIHEFSLLEIENLINLSKFNIRLSDFGTAVSMNTRHPYTIQPAALRAPEVIIGCEWDTSADIWSLGCLVFELLTSRWLFVPEGGPTWTAEAYHLAQMIIITEEDFDISYFGAGKCYTKHFNTEGRIGISVNGRQGLEDTLKAYNIMEDADVLLCVSFLKSMLRLKPSDRASASDLVQHEWLRP